MKNKLLSVLAALGLVPVALAVPLGETTAVQTKPDPSAPAITYLKAGTETPGAAASTPPAPAGWMAIELPGPFEAYVANRDITKNLLVVPGADILLEPKVGSAVLTVMQKGDKIEITGLPHGKWMQIRLEKKLIGYIQVAGASMVSGPATPAVSTPTGLPMSQPAPAPAPATGPGRPAPGGNLGADGSSAALPRLFQGKFVSTHRPLAPRRPYDYQINDDRGVRFAYVDVSKLLLTEQIDKYVDRTVVIFGTAKNDADANGIVIHAESLQLK
jgi:hypothetical protein